jgi:hypothetical protein
LESVKAARLLRLRINKRNLIIDKEDNGKQFKKHTTMKKMESKKEEMKEMKMPKKAYMAKEMKEGKKSTSMTKVGKKMYKK